VSWGAVEAERALCAPRWQARERGERGRAVLRVVLRREARQSGDRACMSCGSELVASLRCQTFASRLAEQQTCFEALQRVTHLFVPIMHPML
jgi:hypothetical protein